MKTAGVLIVIVIMFIGSPDIVGLALVTLFLWHGIWRLIDHFEKSFELDDKPLVSAITTISIGTALAFAMNRSRSQCMEYLGGRF